MSPVTNPERKVFFETYGCQMNVYDVQTMRGALEAAGHQTTERPDEADTYVVTTCAVRESAEERVWGRLGDLKRWKQEQPGRLVVVAGCMAEKNGKAMLKRAPQIDLLVGTANFERVANLIEERSRGSGAVAALGVPRGKLPPGFEWPSPRVSVALPVVSANIPPESDSALPFASWIDRPVTGLHAFVKVMEGCDHFCTYCIVPFTRGKERSRSPEEIEQEVRRLVDRGVREITLLGQNVNSYGRGLAPKVRFSDLLARLDSIPDLLRIRFTTSHPQDCKPDLIAAMRHLGKVCEHFHLPVQSGSDRILGLMNRKYSGAHFLELLAQVREGIPGVSVTTDVIAGFPTETEGDFEDTVRLMDRAQFEGAFLFMFSPRQGTPAATMEGQIPEEVKNRRLQALIRMQNRITERDSGRYVGREVNVLVEGPSERDASRLRGRTRTFKTAIFEGDVAWVGKEVPVRVQRATTWTLYAEAAAGRVG